MGEMRLEEIAKKLVAPGKGILAADESLPTIKKRFDKIGIESTEETRRTYRELLFTTSEIEKYISGVILFDETLRQKAQGRSFAIILEERGIIPGIKVDQGKIEMPNSAGEMVTEGLDGLESRLSEYKSLGAGFTKWRAVFSISENTPTDECIQENTERLGKFAVLSQEAGLVPIVEPEVLMDGGHTIDKCREVTYKVLKKVFNKLDDHGVDLSGMLLKPNMVLSGKESQEKAGSDKVAEATLKCFREVLPDELPGVVFLSGGQSPQQASANLNAMNKVGDAPWELSFSFGRALQAPVLETWQGKRENVETAQKELIKRARLNSLARKGKYKLEMENVNGQ